MNLTLNGEILRLKQGEICIIYPGCIHHFSSINHTDPTYHVGVINESLFVTIPEVYEHYIQPLYHNSIISYDHISAASPYRESMLKLFRTINDLRIEQPPAFELSIIARFHEFFAILWSLHKPHYANTEKHDQKETDAFRKMINYIHQNYAGKISVEELCKTAAVSRNQCFRIFKRFSSESPARYIQHYRLATAKQLLQTSRLTLTEIATACGFTHQSHFTTCFVERYGITPLRCRRNPDRTDEI